MTMNERSPKRDLNCMHFLSPVNSGKNSYVDSIFTFFFVYFHDMPLLSLDMRTLLDL